jgi:calmodulin
MDELSDEQIEEFREAFSLFDPDNKGYIQTKELGMVLRSLGIHASDDEKNEFIEKYDKDKDECIYFKEFLEIITKKIKENNPEDDILDALNLFDVEKKHEIDIDYFKNEYKEHFPKATENEINELIEDLKTRNDNNNLNIQEVSQYLCENIKNQLN